MREGIISVSSIGLFHLFAGPRTTSLMSKWKETILKTDHHVLEPVSTNLRLRIRVNTIEIWHTMVRRPKI